MQDLVTVRTFNSRIEAEIARGVLETNGIRAEITADDAGGAYPFPAEFSSRGVELLVEKKDFERAQKILDLNWYQITKSLKEEK